MQMILLLSLLLFGNAFAQVEKAASQATVEKLELEIYRKRFAEIEAAQQQVTTAPQDAQVHQAYSNYLTEFFKQEVELRQRTIAVLEWQLAAANWILGLVVVATLAGLVFSGYQLWHGTRPRAKGMPSVEMEVSAQRVRLQSSVVGIVVLIISSLLLLLFLREVYQITPISPG